MKALQQNWNRIWDLSSKLRNDKSETKLVDIFAFKFSAEEN